MKMYRVTTFKIALKEAI